VLVVAVSSHSFAARVALETRESPPPELLPEAVRAVLAPRALRLIEDGEAAIELWLRAEARNLADLPREPGANFAALGEGTLVGAVRLSSSLHDARGQKVAPGVYTLRYALQPVDGAHVGTSEFRDFLLLVPGSEDPGAAVRLSREQLVALSKRAAGRAHPAVLALSPWEGSSFPAVVSLDGKLRGIAIEMGGLRVLLELCGAGCPSG